MASRSPALPKAANSSFSSTVSASAWSAHGQVVHASLVPLAKLVVEDVAGDVPREQAVISVEEAGEDRHFVFDMGGGSAHVHSFLVDG